MRSRTAAASAAAALTLLLAGCSAGSPYEAGYAHGQERRGTLGGDLFGQIFHCATWAEEQYEEKADRNAFKRGCQHGINDLPSRP
ncbi:hypothetical protein ACH5AU_16340 [Streptomyces albidoflavus]